MDTMFKQLLILIIGLIILFSFRKKYENLVILGVIVRLFIPFYVRVGSLSLSTISFLLIGIAYFVSRYILNPRTAPSNFISNKILLLLFFLSIISLLGVNNFMSFAFNVKDFIYNFILGIIVLNESKEEKTVKKYRNALLIIGILVAGYGLFNYVTGFNPYITILSLHYPDQRFFIYEEQRFGFSARVQSTLFHTITFGGYMMLFAIWTLYYMLNSKKNQLIYFLSFILFTINGFLSGSRSVLMILVFGMFYLFLYQKIRTKFKMIVISTLFLMAGVSANEQVSNYVFSTVFFWGDHYAEQAEVKGSSAELRINQLEGVIESVPNYRVLVGLGPTYFDNHPKDSRILGAESALFQLYLNYGILGVFLWFALFYYVYHKNNQIRKASNCKSPIILNSLTIGYVFFILATGFMDMTFMYIVLYSILLKTHQIALNNAGIYHNCKF